MKLSLLKEFPLNFDFNSLDIAINEFIKESDEYNVPFDKYGWKQSLLQIIQNVVILKTDNQSFFWMAVENNKCVAFAMTGISRDVDNSLCYWGRCAWVSKDLRGKAVVKAWYQQLREHAKQLMCKHFIVISSRNPKAYIRFLGKHLHPYAVLLKEDL